MIEDVLLWLFAIDQVVDILCRIIYKKRKKEKKSTNRVHKKKESKTGDNKFQMYSACCC